ncbi:hypothetical protein SRABI83_00575 [Arthrobacter sp. Bi83]|nr:hypothetical protein SRABI83_00575 [Arthrobacter sp. Bi83]
MLRVVSYALARSGVSGCRVRAVGVHAMLCYAVDLCYAEDRRPGRSYFRAAVASRLSAKAPTNKPKSRSATS